MYRSVFAYVHVSDVGDCSQLSKVKMVDVVFLIDQTDIQHTTAALFVFIKLLPY